MKRIHLFLSLVAFVIVFSGCRKDNENQPVINDQIQKKPGELNINPAFKFASQKTISVVVTLPYTVDFAAIKGKVDFFYLQGDQQVVVHTGLTDHTGHYEGSFKVPAHIIDIYAKSMGGIIKLDAGPLKSTSDGGIYVNFGNTIDTLAPRLLPATKSTDGSSDVIQLSQISNSNLKAATINNLIGNGDFSTNVFGSINAWYSPMSKDGKWYVTSELSGKVSQFNDGGNMVLKIDKPSYNYGGIAQIIDAGAGDLVTLSGNIKVSGSGVKYAWLYLIPRNAQGNALDYFSVIPSYLPSTWGWYQVSATMPAGTVDCEVVLWINSWGGSIYYDNIVATGPNPDNDNDGVIDTEDDYPSDGARAFNQYYPGSNTFNTLAFEDNWPSRADYDVNDLVVDIQHQMVLNASFELVDLYSRFKIRAIGASFHNALGFELNTAPENIASVTGNSITESIFQFSANNTEAGQEKAVVIVTDNVFKQLPHPGTGIGVNTNKGTPYVEPTTMEIHVAMNTPVLVSSLGNPPFNPFLVVNGNRGREIHMIDNPPTTLADMALFGTSSDNSIPGAGSWYKTTNNLPWVIEIPVSFDYPTEKSAITDGYLKFGIWAESSGTMYPDWYVPGIAGYRNNALIFNSVQ